MIANNLKNLNIKITEACEKIGRTRGEITLVAASKTWPAEKIREAFEAGQKDFGENYSQEAFEKMQQLQDLEIRWHFIGGLQSKKVKAIVNQFSLIHSVDRESLIGELEKRSENPQDILIQVNFEGESSKSGASPEEADRLIQLISESPKLRLAGLMVMPPLENSEAEQRLVFEKVKKFRDSHSKLKELSMGTTHDFELAIEYGSTMIRLGTAIFGERGK